MSHLLGLFLTLSLHISADNRPVFSCYSEPLTTSLELVDNGSHYKLLWTHHLGVKAMPLHQGPISPQDLPKLQQKASQLMKMGTHVQVSFPKESCIRSSNQWSCHLSSPISLGNLSLRGVSLVTATQEVIWNQELQWSTTEVYLSFLTADEDHLVRQSFPQGQCQNP